MYNGCIDNQTPEQKAKNYQFNELVASANPVIWEERDWKRYKLRTQDGSGSCVAMSIATAVGIKFQQKYNEWKDFSSAFTYRRRGGDYSGMTTTDVLNIVPKKGNVFEEFLQGQNMSDEQIAKLKEPAYLEDLAKAFKMNVVFLPLDFETVASTIQTTGHAIVWFKFANADWTDFPFDSGKPITSGHSVCAVDAVLYKGKKYIVIQDSWGKTYGLKGYRLISEEYFNARCFNAFYLFNFKVVSEAVEKPKFDGSVKSLQDCLK